MKNSIFSISICNYLSYAPTNQNIKFNQSTKYQSQTKTFSKKKLQFPNTNTIPNHT